MNPIAMNDRRALQRVANAIQLLRMVDSHMPAGAARAFIEIALGGVESVVDLKRKLGCGLSTASRYAHYLSDSTRFKKPGKGLVAMRVDPEDGRRKIIELTAAGGLLVGMLKNAVAPQ